MRSVDRGGGSKTSPIGCRQGVALPTVLFCLLALAALLSGLVVTTSTELIVSLAHSDAIEDRYLAEGAVHAWIAEQADGLDAVEDLEWTPGGASTPVRIVVERLSSPTERDRRSLFAVHAAPLRGGRSTRSAVAQIRTRDTEPSPFTTNVLATVTAGGGGYVENAISSGHTLYDGRDTECTDSDFQAVHPFLYSDGSVLQQIGSAPLQGDPFASADPGDALLSGTLDGHPLRDLGWNADVHFGRYFNEPAWDLGGAVSSGNGDARYDWGCPADLLARMPPGSVPPCDVGADPDGWRMIAIDAANDTVRVEGHHGQGMLIVINGHLHIGGAFVYRGLILVERSVIVSGGGIGWPPSIEGAIVAGGLVTVLDGRDPSTGSATSPRRSIRFDRCAINRVVNAFNAAGPDRWQSRRVLGRPHAWSETVD